MTEPISTGGPLTPADQKSSQSAPRLTRTLGVSNVSREVKRLMPELVLMQKNPSTSDASSLFKALETLRSQRKASKKIYLFAAVALIGLIVLGLGFGLDLKGLWIGGGVASVVGSSAAGVTYLIRNKIESNAINKIYNSDEFKLYQQEILKEFLRSYRFLSAVRMLSHEDEKAYIKAVDSEDKTALKKVPTYETPDKVVEMLRNKTAKILLDHPEFFGVETNSEEQLDEINQLVDRTLRDFFIKALCIQVISKKQWVEHKGNVLLDIDKDFHIYKGEPWYDRFGRIVLYHDGKPIES